MGGLGLVHEVVLLWWMGGEGSHPFARPGHELHSTVVSGSRLATEVAVAGGEKFSLVPNFSAQVRSGFLAAASDGEQEVCMQARTRPALARGERRRRAGSLFSRCGKIDLRRRGKNKTSGRPSRSDGESGSARGRRDRNAAAPLLLSKKKKSFFFFLVLCSLH